MTLDVCKKQTENPNQTCETNWAVMRNFKPCTSATNEETKEQKDSCDLGKNPQLSINATCNGWNDTRDAYRLFNEPDVTLPVKSFETLGARASRPPVCGLAPFAQLFRTTMQARRPRSRNYLTA